MNYNIVCLLLGMLVGYIGMYLTSNIVTYHGANSNVIRNLVFFKNGNKYRFTPKLK